MVDRQNQRKCVKILHKAKPSKSYPSSTWILTTERADICLSVWLPSLQFPVLNSYNLGYFCYKLHYLPPNWGLKFPKKNKKKQSLLRLHLQYTVVQFNSSDSHKSIVLTWLEYSIDLWLCEVFPEVVVMAAYKTYIKALSSIQMMKQGFIISPTRTWFNTVKLKWALYKFLKQTT